MGIAGRPKPLRVAIAAVLYGIGGFARADISDTGGVLEEIVVTATRRSTSILDTPYTIQAVSGQDLANSGVSDISNLVHLVPGLALFDEGPRTSGNRNTFNIRGLNANNAYNNDDNPSLSQSAVSTYFGETPVFFPFKLVDLDRVEVLRGPQGTLYGASSIGGTVRFIPNAPDPRALTADVNAEISKTEHASDPSYDGSLAVNIPLNDRSAIRAVVGHEYLSGFINADGLVRQTGTAMNPGPIILQDPANFLTSPPAQAAPVHDYNKAHLDFLRASALIGINDAVNVRANFAYQENNAAGRNEDNPYYGSGQRYQFYTAFTAPQISRIKLYDVDVNADLGFATLTSASGFTSTSSHGVSDSSGYERTHLASYYFGYPRLYAPIERSQEVDSYTQEIRLVSKESSTLEWIVGAYYNASHLAFHLLQNAPGINQYTNEVLGLNPSLDFTDTLAIGYTSTTFKDLAGFGELTWHLTDRWQATGGVRVFHETLNGISGVPLPYASLTTQYFVAGVANNPYYLAGYLPVSSSVNDHIFKFNSSYKFSDQALAYLTVSQGFRPGGANALPTTDPLGNNNRPYLLFKPDTDTNYEVGLKGRVGERFSYVADLFFINWQNFQATLYTPFGVNYVANVAPARSQGFEVALNGNLTKQLSAGFNYTYIKAYVRQAFEYQGGLPSTTVPAGSPLPGSSKNVFSEFVEYQQPLPRSELLFRVDGSYKGPSQSNFVDIPNYFNSNFTTFSSISVWNSSITWKRDQYGITVFGDNLSNSRGTSLASTAELYGARDQSYGVIRPRTVGLRFRWSYK